ncbi:hypothetical protein DFQ28_003491 [Apophysomyces sp. BC1034]|nr:hypothetical protein DFQ28_003491 [Apophysomyces sp. BC1034]
MATAALPLYAFAAGIFNVGPAATSTETARTQQLPVQPAQSGYQPVTPPAASAFPPIKADPKAMAQFERYPNESDDAYIARMKVVYQRSVADMERVNRENMEKMKALAPPK